MAIRMGGTLVRATRVDSEGSARCHPSRHDRPLWLFFMGHSALDEFQPRLRCRLSSPSEERPNGPTGGIRGGHNRRRNLQFDEYTWYFGLSPLGPKTPTPSFYRASIKDLKAFNDRLEKCQAVLDARADNLLQFVDRITNDIGNTSAILRDRSEKYNSGWFDTRADNLFWFAYGQLYAYYGILSAARADFRDVIAQRDLGELWRTLEEQLRAAR